MDKLTVSSLPIRHVISDIARELDTKYHTSCGLFYLDIPEGYGQGVIVGTDFNDGLGLIRYDCTFKNDLTIEYSVDKVHPVKFLFSMDGEIQHRFLNQDVWHEIPKYKNAIVASAAHHGHCIKFKAGKQMVYSSLELDRRRFLSKIRCQPDNMAKSWKDMLYDVSAEETFYHDGFYSLELSQILEKWDAFANGDWRKVVHLEGLAYRILVLQITQFMDDIKSEGQKTMLRKSELNNILEAVNFIENNLNQPLTVSTIARKVGLNVNKLQQGFKELTGNTVNLHLKEKRMLMAKTLLLKTDQTIGTIALNIGYQSPSYLSKIFLQTYGISPSDLRKNKNPSVIPQSNLKQ